MHALEKFLLETFSSSTWSLSKMPETESVLDFKSFEFGAICLELMRYLSHVVQVSTQWNTFGSWLPCTQSPRSYYTLYLVHMSLTVPII